MVLRNKKIVYTAAAAILLVLVFVPFPSLTIKGKGAVRGAVAPAERGSSGLWKRLAEASAAIRGIGGTAEENLELSRDVVRLQTKLNSLRDVEEDNARLRRAFEFYQEEPDTLIPCDVVSRNISGWWRTVRIGKGSKAGIAPDLAVINPEGLIGKTAEVTPFTAEILLISDPSFQISAQIKREEQDVFGLVRGAGSTLKGEPRARIEFINKDIPIRKGDEVVTSGLGAFPKGVHIGYINEVTRDASGLFQSAEILPRATVGLLDYLFVVAPSNGRDAE